MRRYITNCGLSLIGFAIVAICTACDQGTGELKKRMDALEIKVAGMEGSIQATTKISFEGGRRHSVELDSSDSGNKSYQAISTSDNTFIFLVMLNDIKPFANGYKVSLNIGNPSSISFSGLDMKIVRGPAPPEIKDKEFSKKYEAWSNLTKTAEQSFTDSFPPGTWKVVEFIAAPATSSDLGYLELSDVKTKQVYLR